MIDYKLCLREISTIQSAWKGHRDFALWLVDKLNPTTIVDLGVDYGFSTLCFALPNKGMVYGIDSFEGDPQTGIRTTYSYVKDKIQKLEINNIELIAGNFNVVASTWNKPIDILHIDGYHTYEAVKNDYETWSKFVKDDGIILFHDTNVNDPSFGVKRFFDEINLPKFNFENSAGLGVVSKNKNLIDSVQKDFGKNNKIAVFYHVAQIGEWEKMYHDQLHSLQISGLYDACDYFATCINGDRDLPFFLDKQTVGYNNDHVLEANTLECLWNFCVENPNSNVMYYHTKGVTHVDESIYDFPLKYNINSWRLYMEYFAIHKWKDRQIDLTENDAVGVELKTHARYGPNFDLVPALYFDGNFWWSKSSYITTLDKEYLYSNDKWARWRSERWIGTKNGKLKSCYDFNYTDHHSYYRPYHAHKYIYN